MIFDVLKNRWLRKQQEIYRGRQRDRQQSAPESMVVIYNADAEKSLEFADQWSKDLKIKDLTLIGFTTDKKAVSSDKNILLTPASLKWTGGIADDFLKKALETNFDLQINFYRTASDIPSFVAMALRSGFKVGFPSQDEEQYDLAIDVPLEKKDLFFTELKRYLNIIIK